MFDFIVFCAGKETPDDIFPNTDIYIEKEQRYCDIWKFITQQKGAWYSLLADENEIAGTDICEHLGYSDSVIFPEIDSEINECISPYKIRQEYKDDVKKIMEYLIECSPMKTIYVLARYQSSEKEIVRGTYSIEKFFSMMDSETVYANVCYIVSEQPNAL